MTKLFLDLGTTTGWAISSNKHPITSGTISFKGGRFEGGGMRFLRFSQWLDKTRQLVPIDAIYFEEVRKHRGVDAAHIYGGFLAHLSAWCEDQQIPYEGIPVGSIKRSVTGKGNASKEMVMEKIRELGHNPSDDNEADALAILYTQMKDK